MPGLPLAVRDTMNHGCSCSHSRTNPMCRQQSRVRLTTEEQLAAEESLSVYCKPVELYNILQRRAIQNPSFLQRSLLYKIQAKYKRRYDPSTGIYGMDFYVVLERPGYRVARRRRCKSRVGIHQRVTKDDAMKWFQVKYEGVILNKSQATTA